MSGAKPPVKRQRTSQSGSNSRSEFSFQGKELSNPPSQTGGRRPPANTRAPANFGGSSAAVRPRTPTRLAANRSDISEMAASEAPSQVSYVSRARSNMSHLSCISQNSNISELFSQMN